MFVRVNINEKASTHTVCVFMRVNINEKALTHTLPSMKSWVPILTTVHPIALAELRQSVWFSFLSQGFSALLVLIARSSIVPGTATLISLLQKNKMILNNQTHFEETSNLTILTTETNMITIEVLHPLRSRKDH